MLVLVNIIEFNNPIIGKSTGSKFVCILVINQPLRIKAKALNILMGTI
jgi:hypothetical protein